MNLFSTIGGELTSLPTGTYFVVGTVQIDLSVEEGLSADQFAFITAELTGDFTTIAIEGIGVVPGGDTSGVGAVTVHGIVTLTSSGSISLGYSLTQEGEETISGSIATSQLQALQLQCETLTTD
jgi:hypothetical protein